MSWPPATPPPSWPTLWSPEHKVVLERRLWLAVLRAQRDLGIEVPGRRVADYERVLDEVDLASHRRAREGHPARREGADRGVQRPRRPRAGAQGHDLPRPHRERRAAADPALPGAGARPHGGGARPARQAAPASTPSWSWPAARTTSPRRPPRWASGSRPPPTSCWWRTRRLEELLARYPLRGIKGPVGTAQDMLDLLGGDAAKLADLERADRRAPRLRAGAHQRRPGLPALARLRRGDRAGAAGGRAVLARARRSG